MTDKQFHGCFFLVSWQIKQIEDVDLIPHIKHHWSYKYEVQEDVDWSEGGHNLTEKQNKPIREIKPYECQNQQSATFLKRINPLVSSATAKRPEGPH